MATFSTERIAAIIKGRRSIRKVDFPPLGCVIWIRALSESECDAARIEAARYCKKHSADLDIDPEFYDREVRRQMVWRSTVDADHDGDSPPPFFPSDKDLLSLDSALIHLLFQAYLEVQEEIVPAATLTAEEVEELVQALGKEDGPDRLLSQYGPDTLRRCVRSLASRLHAT